MRFYITLLFFWSFASHSYAQSTIDSTLTLDSIDIFYKSDQYQLIDSQLVAIKKLVESNAPEGNPKRCTDGCPAEATCPYSALKIYHRDRTWLHHFDLPEDKSKHGDVIMDYLKTSDYGRCVYRMDNGQPDHYTVNMLFEDDVTVSFNMEAFTSYHGRRTRIMGSMGDIVGDMYSYKWTDFRTGKIEEWDNKTDGNGGGDWNIMSDWTQAVAHKDESLLTSNIGASIESHIMGFAAEKSRKGDTIEKIIL